jgi:phage tail tape-measure protein
MSNDTKTSDTTKTGDTNPDLITGNPGSHPAGTGIGAASGAATGAALGAIGGPVGAVIGGVSGAVVGGLIGHGIGEAVDPTEDAYWRENHKERPYVREGQGYDDYEPAYRLGYNAADSSRSDSGVAAYTDETDSTLREKYDSGYRGESKLDWDDAKPAVRDAYDRRAESHRATTSA